MELLDVRQKFGNSSNSMKSISLNRGNSIPSTLSLQNCNSVNTLLEPFLVEYTTLLSFNRWQIQSANGVVSVTSKAIFFPLSPMLETPMSTSPTLRVYRVNLEQRPNKLWLWKRKLFPLNKLIDLSKGVDDSSTEFDDIVLAVNKKRKESVEQKSMKPKGTKPRVEAK
ncbi:hypothetical protein H5410_062143 [Solanum commersonii]|uniref:Uncharacterized protein n=1 Tax=Solanum commersonii TaxID=4109 RepID=A0A9J5W9W1_SOLCO|nr:hypothetical protein H5410_062143 [Solanum commersonii]